MNLRNPLVALLLALSILSAILIVAAVVNIVRGRNRAPDGPATTARAETEPTASRRAFTIGRETTWVDGPLDSTGRIDYAAALNRIISKDVTPDSNGAVDLWRAIGPQSEGKPVPTEYFRRLGISPPPAKGSYFVPLRSFASGEDPARVQALDQAVVKHPWNARDYPEVATALEANRAPLELVLQSIPKPHFYSPFVGSPENPKSYGMIDGGWPQMVPCREIARALTARAMLHSDRGDFEKAKQDLNACHRLAAQLGRGPTSVDLLIAIVVENAALQAELGYLSVIAEDPKRLVEFQTALGQFPPLPDLAEKLDLGERFVSLDSIMMLDRHGVAYLPRVCGSDDAAARSPLKLLLLDPIDWDPALQVQNGHFNQIVAALRLGSRNERIRELNRLEADAAATRKRIGDGVELARPIRDAKSRGEAVGEMLRSVEYDQPTNSEVDSARKCMTAVDRSFQLRANLKTASGLELYRQTYGHYPESLAKLVPRFLPQLPMDIFTGKPLIVRGGGLSFHFYSVGPNLRDDGGVLHEDGRDDLGIQLPVPRK